MKDKKYYLLYTSLKNKIISGEYIAEQKLPSKRVMADMTGLSIITVQNAYNMLIDEGYIVSKERSGYFVCKADGFAARTGESAQASFDYVEDPPVTDSRDFEYSVWFKTVRKVISEDGDRLFVKSPSKGCAILRNAIADYLLRYRGMVAPPERIIIGSGSEQLYESIVKILGRDKIFGVEDPCYRQITAVYEGMGVKLRRLKMGNDGIESRYIAKNNFDVLHTTPFHSYPSGVTTSASRRYEYLDWAKKNNKYIIEDDFDSEFFLPGQPIQSLYSSDDAHRVIYVNTFSKSLSPSMRLGYMILPPELLKVYDEELGHYSCTVPVMEQYVLAEFISGGNFERHLNRVRRKNKQR